MLGSWRVPCQPSDINQWLRGCLLGNVLAKTVFCAEAALLLLPELPEWLSRREAVRIAATEGEIFMFSIV